MTVGVGGVGAGTASAASSTTTSTQSVLATWRYYDTFSSYLKCLDKGAALERSGYASDSRCDSDHPFWQLWVLR
ncbi:hypothetical protein ACIBF6_10015 [Streptosporangium amethystogenes]|uniref:hypothetical protein n=1 Tax=Streptosporangium amethystogenes TaxID=2002 RepID=UPI003797962D